MTPKFVRYTPPDTDESYVAIVIATHSDGSTDLVVFGFVGASVIRSEVQPHEIGEAPAKLPGMPVAKTARKPAAKKPAKLKK